MLIDTSERDVISLSVFDENKKQDIRIEKNNRELLRVIVDFLNTQKIKKEDVAGIMVAVGEGSFTSTRLATTVANTFAYVREIPLLPVSKAQAADPQMLISELQVQPAKQYISATYSAAPSIGGE